MKGRQCPQCKRYTWFQVGTALHYICSKCGYEDKVPIRIVGLTVREEQRE